MLNRLVTFSLEQRVFVIVLSVFIAIAGLYSLRHTPIEAFPDVQDVQVRLITLAPGLAPEEVERAVTLPIERGMSGVPHMTQLRSVSLTGLSIVTLTFADRTDDYFARQQVGERLRNIELPEGLRPEIGPLTTAVGEIYRYVLATPPDMPLFEARALQDWIVEPALKRVAGVADVVGFGGGIKEYQVRANPVLLRKHGLSIDQLAKALADASANAGGGLMRQGDENLVVRSLGLFSDIEQIRRTVVTVREGKPIFVADVAHVDIEMRNRSGIVAVNEHDDVVAGIVSMIKRQNPSTVVDEVRAEVHRLNDSVLPPGVRIEPIYERTKLVSHTLHTVGHNLVVGAILVVGVLLIFLRSWIAALSVALIIPLSMLFAFIFIHLLGVSANLISLGAVDFGIIVDGAVVLVEALMVRLALAQTTTHPHQASYAWRLGQLKHTVVEMGHPILFAKAIIILAFLPIFSFERVEGKIFSPMAFTLSFAILGAILLSLTLVPALLSYAIRHHDMSEQHSHWMQALQRSYRHMLEGALRWRWPVLAGSLILLSLTLILAPRLGSEFLPKLDEGNIYLTLQLPPATALDKTKEVERDIRRLLRDYPEVNTVISHVGRPDDGTDPKGANNLEILVDLKPREQWRFPDKEHLIEDMSAQLKRIPGLPTNFSQVIQDNVEEAISGVQGEIAVKLFGSDLDVLEDKAAQVAALLRQVQGASDVAVLRARGQSELTIHLNRELMARYGLNVEEVNATVQTALAGLPVNRFYEQDRVFDITVRLERGFRDSVEDVRTLPIRLPDGSGTLALDSIADVRVKQGASRINREAGTRYVAVKANLLGRDQGSFVAEAMQKVGEQVHLPPGYRLTWGGQFENQQRAMKRLSVIVPLSLAGIFVLLFWAFGSVRFAALVMLMVPFTLIGGLAGLGLAGLHLSVSAAVGFIAVAGISVQNGVIMLEKFLESLRNGVELNEAVLEGAASRLRPILMTALMAGLGLLPAALSDAIGAETQRPFAVVIVGGVVSATFFTLLLLPLLFRMMAGNPSPTKETA
ncbi:MAG: CusA/CzcA family heavy metal efflux RND transporter [Halothiobacillaceae bacterium]|jgi:cobalt-zinc-cadmium resistance protein CzcA|nr:CusA/CzcA family heavy metal efflux RND transporter [Halothiobacillaceae bacterium]